MERDRKEKGSYPETFGDYSHTVQRRRLWERFREGPKWVLVIPVVAMTLFVAGVLPILYRQYEAREERRAVRGKQEKHKFLSRRFEIFIEDDPGKQEKDISFVEVSRALLELERLPKAYLFVLPSVVETPFGVNKVIDYRIGTSSINKQKVVPELQKGDKGEQKLFVGGEPSPFQQGENSITVRFDALDVPIQDRFGNESFAWKLPTKGQDIIEELEILIALPSYATQETVQHEVSIENSRGVTRRAPRAFDSTVQQLKGKERVVLRANFSSLAPKERAKILVKW